MMVSFRRDEGNGRHGVPREHHPADRRRQTTPPAIR
jgi:hypothetical protein